MTDECKHGLWSATCSICLRDERSAEAGVGSPMSWRDGSVSAEFLAALESLGGTATVSGLARHLKWEQARVRRIAAYLRDEFSAVVVHQFSVSLEPHGLDRFAKRDRNYHPSHLFPSERGARLRKTRDRGLPRRTVSV